MAPSKINSSSANNFFALFQISNYTQICPRVHRLRMSQSHILLTNVSVLPYSHWHFLISLIELKPFWYCQWLRFIMLFQCQFYQFISLFPLAIQVGPSSIVCCMSEDWLQPKTPAPSHLKLHLLQITRQVARHNCQTAPSLGSTPQFCQYSASSLPLLYSRVWKIVVDTTTREGYQIQFISSLKHGMKTKALLVPTCTLYPLKSNCLLIPGVQDACISKEVHDFSQG